MNKLLSQLNNCKICEGIVYPDVKPLSHLKKHIISKRFHLPTYSADMMEISFSEECSQPTSEVLIVLIQEEDILCMECHLEQVNLRRSLNKKSKITATPAHKKALGIKLHNQQFL